MAVIETKKDDIFVGLFHIASSIDNCQILLAILDVAFIT